MKKLCVVFLLALVLASCATLPARKAPRDFAFSRDLRHDIFSSLQRRNDAVRSLRGFANVRYGSSIFGGVFGARGETTFAVKRPYHLRIDSLSDFGLYNSQIAIVRGDLTILWPGDNSYYRRLADSRAMERYLMIDLNPEQAIEILLGRVPMEDEEEYGVRELKKGRRFLLQGEHGEVIVESKDGPYLPVQYTAYDTDGLMKYRIDYSDYRRERDVLFAGHLLVRFFDPRSRIEIFYNEVEINPTLEDKLFEIKLPNDAKQLNEAR